MKKGRRSEPNETTVIKWIKRWVGKCALMYDCHDCEEANKCSRNYRQVQDIIHLYYSMGWNKGEKE